MLALIQFLFKGAIAVISLLSGEVIQNMSDDYAKKLIPRNETTSNSSDYTHDILKYKVIVACSLSFFVGMLQIIMVNKENLLKY